MQTKLQPKNILFYVTNYFASKIKTTDTSKYFNISITLLVINFIFPRTKTIINYYLNLVTKIITTHHFPIHLAIYRTHKNPFKFTTLIPKVYYIRSQRPMVCLKG